MQPSNETQRLTATPSGSAETEQSEARERTSEEERLRLRDADKAPDTYSPERGELSPSTAPIGEVRTSTASAGEFTSSAAPIGEGSNTPVGDEPSSFQAWDARHPESTRDEYSTSSGGLLGTLQQNAGWAAPSGAGLTVLAVVGGLLYRWWRQRQERRSRVVRLRRALEQAGQLAGSRVPKVVGRAAGSTSSPWVAFALAPIALWLQSQGRAGKRAGKEILQPLDLEERAIELARQTSKKVEQTAPRLIHDKAPTIDQGPGWRPWLLALPAVGGGLYVAGRRLLESGSAPTDAFGPTSIASPRMVRDVMSRDVQVIGPSTTLAEAARKMRDLDVGSLPIQEGTRLLGVVTDRDISIRATADGKDPKTTQVRQVMSPEVAWVFEDETAQSAAQVMRQRQIRRLPVLDRSDKLVGVLSIGDLARELGQDDLTSETLEQISRPNR